MSEYIGGKASLELGEKEPFSEIRWSVVFCVCLCDCVAARKQETTEGLRRGPKALVQVVTTLPPLPTLTWR